jgi:hypothetical protein
MINYQMMLPVAVKVPNYGSCRTEMNFNYVTSCSEISREKKSSFLTYISMG